MENRLSLREALGLGFMFAFKNVGTLFLLAPFPIILFALRAFFNNYFQNIAIKFSVDLLFNWFIAVFGTLIILPIFLGIYRTGKPAYTLLLSKTLLMRVIAVTFINEVILLNLDVFSLLRESSAIRADHFWVFLAVEVLMTAVFIFLVYPYAYFSTFFVVDQNVSVKEALKRSADIVNGHALYLFFVTLLLGIIWVLSILTIVGPIFFGGAVEIVFIHFYHVLQNRKHEMVRLH